MNNKEAVTIVHRAAGFMSGLSTQLHPIAPELAKSCRELDGLLTQVASHIIIMGCDETVNRSTLDDFARVKSSLGLPANAGLVDCIWRVDSLRADESRLAGLMD